MAILFQTLDKPPHNHLMTDKQYAFSRRRSSLGQKIYNLVARIRHVISAPSSVTTEDIVPQEFLVLCPNDDFASVSRIECVHADEHNLWLHNKVIRITAKHAYDMVISLDKQPPGQSNTERYDNWVARNKPVSANDQSRAVSLLVANGRRVDVHYKPQEAIAAAAIYDQVNLCTVSLQNNQSYYNPTDTELMAMSGKDARRLDRANAKSYKGNVSAARRTYQKISRVTYAIMKVNPPPPRSLAQHRTTLLSRHIKVPAFYQAQAVEQLFLVYGLKVFEHYKPQNAIAEFKSRCQNQHQHNVTDYWLQTAPPQPPSTPLSCDASARDMYPSIYPSMELYGKNTYPSATAALGPPESCPVPQGSDRHRGHPFLAWEHQPALLPDPHISFNSLCMPHQSATARAPASHV